MFHRISRGHYQCWCCKCVFFSGRNRTQHSLGECESYQRISCTTLAGFWVSLSQRDWLILTQIVAQQTHSELGKQRLRPNHGSYRNATNRPVWSIISLFLVNIIFLAAKHGSKKKSNIFLFWQNSTKKRQLLCFSLSLQETQSFFSFSGGKKNGVNFNIFWKTGSEDDRSAADADADTDTEAEADAWNGLPLKKVELETEIGASFKLCCRSYYGVGFLLLQFNSSTDYFICLRGPGLLPLHHNYVSNY